MQIIESLFLPATWHGCNTVYIAQLNVRDKVKRACYSVKEMPEAFNPVAIFIVKPKPCLTTSL